VRRKRDFFMSATFANVQSKAALRAWNEYAQSLNAEERSHLPAGEGIYTKMRDKAPWETEAA